MIKGKLTITSFPFGSSNLACLEPSLKAMLEHMDEYINSFHLPEKGELNLPYCLIERALVGLFAGGVWRSNPKNLVLEEYSAVKHSDAGKVTGRNDFWCRAEGRTIYLEAKKTPWYSLDNPEAIMDNVQHNLLNEYQAAYLNASKEHASEEFDHICGVVFNTPFLAVKKMSNSKAIMDANSLCIQRRLTTFTSATALSILHARYFWTDLLNKEVVFTGEHEIQRYPVFDVYFATKEKVTN